MPTGEAHAPVPGFGDIGAVASAQHDVLEQEPHVGVIFYKQDVRHAADVPGRDVLLCGQHDNPHR